MLTKRKPRRSERRREMSDTTTLYALLAVVWAVGVGIVLAVFAVGDSNSKGK